MEITGKEPDAEFNIRFEQIRQAVIDNVETDFLLMTSIDNPPEFSSVVKFLESMDIEEMFSELSTFNQTAIKDQLRSLASVVEEEHGLKVTLEDIWEAGNLVDIRIYYFDIPDANEYGLPTADPVNIVNGKNADQINTTTEKPEEGEYFTAEMETARRRETAELESVEPYTFSGKCFKGHTAEFTADYRGPKPKIKGTEKKCYIDLDYGDVSCGVEGCVNDEGTADGIRNKHFGKPRRVSLFYRHTGTSKAELKEWIKKNLRKVSKVE